MPRGLPAIAEKSKLTKVYNISVLYTKQKNITSITHFFILFDKNINENIL